jgi:hypothetical protein
VWTQVGRCTTSYLLAGLQRVCDALFASLMRMSFETIFIMFIESYKFLSGTTNGKRNVKTSVVGSHFLLLF